MLQKFMFQSSKQCDHHQLGDEDPDNTKTSYLQVTLMHHLVAGENLNVVQACHQVFQQQQVVQLKPPLCLAIYFHFLNKMLRELYLNGPVCFIATQNTVVPFKRKKPRCINRTIIQDDTIRSSLLKHILVQLH